MRDIAVGSEYLPILRDRCIYKVQIKLVYTMDDDHAPGFIDGCAVICRV